MILKRFYKSGRVVNKILVCRMSTDRIRTTNMKGRDVISPLELTEGDLKCILWTATEMKAKTNNLNLLQPYHVTFVNAAPLAGNQISFERAIQDLGGQYSVFQIPTSASENNGVDYGRLFSSLTDLIVTNGMGHSDTQTVANGANIPVLAARSDLFAIVKVLADIFTLLEVIGPLRRKCLAWVGPVTPITETYLCLCPKVGLNIRLHCFCPHGSGMMSPKSLPQAHRLCGSEIHDCSNLEEAVYRADIIATSHHNDSRKKITFKALEEAALDWCFIHSLPRSGNEVSDDVFRHKNNLTWLSTKNTKYIFMALLLRLLTEHPLTTPMPDFDGPP